MPRRLFPLFPGAAALLLVAGCARPPAPARPAGGAVAVRPGTAAPAPGLAGAALAAAEVLGRFWQAQQRGDWKAAYPLLTGESRAAFGPAELKGIAAQQTPTAQAGQVWAALFPPAGAARPHVSRGTVGGDRAELAVPTAAGQGTVVLRRESGKWRIDLLGTLNAAGDPAGPGGG